MPTSAVATPRDLSGRMVVVTGAGPGSIGLATARTLADWGAEVVVSTRSERVAGFDWHPLDLADRASVQAFADWLLDRYADRLDVLVNNAGVHLDLRKQWTEPQLVDGHEIHWRTNYLGTAQLTRLLLPALLDRAATTGDARVVHVVSKLHARGTNAALFDGVQPYDSWSAYGTSKLALVHDAAELVRRHEADGLRAMSLHPGSVYTRIADRGLETSPLLGRLRALAAPLEKRVLMTPEQGAQTTMHCVSDPDARSGYFRGCAATEPATDALDVVVSRRLWDATEAWIAGSGASDAGPDTGPDTGP
ncbi:MAG TPA: SDR family NAD(P)-dependent oxidoreductase [Marmoricola sp.]|nr:SDR family NAD(P)-dependent oxidoreductase [Marmoricola sp.]